MGRTLAKVYLQPDDAAVVKTTHDGQTMMTGATIASFIRRKYNGKHGEMDIDGAKIGVDQNGTYVIYRPESG